MSTTLLLIVIDERSINFRTVAQVSLPLSVTLSAYFSYPVQCPLGLVFCQCIGPVLALRFIIQAISLVRRQLYSSPNHIFSFLMYINIKFKSKVGAFILHGEPGNCKLIRAVMHCAFGLYFGATKETHILPALGKIHREHQHLFLFV